MRTLVPAETLVYLETNDLAAALQPIVDSKAFTEAAKSKPDFSAIRGVQLAVAVTGFETSEEKLTDEHSVGRVQPHFVAVADTHAWNYQAVAFAEKKLSSFVTEIYDSEPTLEKSDKNGGKYFIWKAKDGRKAYALVIDSIIYFGNDETAIEKCLAVKRGEADSIAKAGKVQPAAADTLASGYVGPDGIAQISNIIGLKLASEMGEDSEVQSAIAGILPQLLRGTVTEITWTSTKSDQGIEDEYQITMPPEIASVFSETMAAGDSNDSKLISGVPADSESMTLYKLKDPQLAWRSILLVAGKQTDAVSGELIVGYSKMLFEPYGIQDPELYLSSVGMAQSSRTILSVKLDPSDLDEPLVLAYRGDDEKMLRSIDPELIPKSSKAADGSITWGGSQGDFRMVFLEDVAKIGTRRTASSWAKTVDIEKSDFCQTLLSSKAVVTTVGRDRTTTESIARLLSETKSLGNALSRYVIETRFTKTGIDRRTTSDFGLIGSIIAQLNGE